jgi:hypothetical protein
MTASSLPISRLINVSVNLSPLPAQMQNLSNLLLMGSSDVIDTTERLRNYLTLAAVASDFGTTAPEYLAAALWFEQQPQPTQISIGRWAQIATSGRLRGGALSAAAQAIANFTSITTGAFEFLLNGIPTSVTGLNFSAAQNLNGVASTIQTALNAIIAGTTCVWNAVYQRFEIESAGSTGTGSIVGFLNSPTATGSATFSTQPAANDTLTIDGTIVTFVAGTPSGNQVQIGASLAATLQNLLTFLSASTDVNLVKMTYYVVGSVLYFASVATGSAGNALTLVKSSTAITLSGATLSGGTGADVSALLGGTAKGGGYVAPGIAAETAAAAVTIFDNQFGQQWYGLQMVAGATSDRLSVAALIEGLTNKHIFGVTTQDASVLVAGNTSNIAYQLQQLGYNRTTTQYSSSNPHAVASLLGRILTTNYNANNSVITLMWKQEPGIIPENLAASQVAALESYNCNVFLEYNNNTAIIEQGVVASGNFLDTVIGTDWLALDIQTTLFNILYTSATKIPQTDAGNQILATGIESVCSQGVQNGLLAAGTWTAAGFGSLNTGDFLPKGFYVYTPPISSQNPTDRAARKSVTFQVAAKLAGAIHTVDVIVNVNR